MASDLNFDRLKNFKSFVFYCYYCQFTIFDRIKIKPTILRDYRSLDSLLNLAERWQVAKFWIYMAFNYDIRFTKITLVAQNAVKNPLITF